MNYRFSAGIIYNNYRGRRPRPQSSVRSSSKPRKPFWMSA
jgi:hypothetical protein